MKALSIYICSLLFCLSCTAQQQQENSFKPILNEKAKLLNASGFVKGEGESGHGKEWVIGHDKWEIMEDGTIKGKRSQSDHSAGLRTNVGTLPQKTILEFKFRFDDVSGNKGKHKFNVRYMGAGKSLVFNPTEKVVTLRTQKADKGSEILVEEKVKLEKNKWYSVMIEIRDEEYCLQMTGIKAQKGRHPQIKARAKKFMAFNVGEAQASAKDVKLWEGK